MGFKGAVLAALALAVLLPGWARADSDDDDYKAFVTECGRADVPLDDIDDCLERSREFADTRPSPELQTITARLERRSEEGDAGDAKPAVAASASGAPQALSGTSTAANTRPAPADTAAIPTDSHSEEVAPREYDGGDDTAPPEPGETGNATGKAQPAGPHNEMN